MPGIPRILPDGETNLGHNSPSIRVSIELIFSAVSSKSGLMMVGRRNISNSVGVYFIVLGRKNFLQNTEYRLEDYILIRWNPPVPLEVLPKQ